MKQKVSEVKPPVGSKIKIHVDWFGDEVVTILGEEKGGTLWLCNFSQGWDMSKSKTVKTVLKPGHLDLSAYPKGYWIGNEMCEMVELPHVSLSVKKGPEKSAPIKDRLYSFFASVPDGYCACNLPPPCKYHPR